MHLAVDAQKRSVGVQNGGGIVVDSGRAAFEEGCDDHHAAVWRPGQFSVEGLELLAKSKNRVSSLAEIGPKIALAGKRCYPRRRRLGSGAGGPDSSRDEGVTHLDQTDGCSFDAFVGHGSWGPGRTHRMCVPLKPEARAKEIATIAMIAL